MMSKLDYHYLQYSIVLLKTIINLIFYSNYYFHLIDYLLHQNQVISNHFLNNDFITNVIIIKNQINQVSFKFIYFLKEHLISIKFIYNFKHLWTI